MATLNSTTSVLFTVHSLVSSGNPRLHARVERRRTIDLWLAAHLPLGGSWDGQPSQQTPVPTAGAHVTCLPRRRTVNHVGRGPRSGDLTLRPLRAAVE